MNKNLIPFAILAVIFGVVVFIFGGWDDSPGAQLLGFIAVVLGAFALIKTKKKTLKTPRAPKAVKISKPSRVVKRTKPVKGSRTK